MRLYSALYDEFYPFDKMLPEWERVCVDVTDPVTGPGALIIWGGGDIHPSLYSRANMGTYSGETLSARDQAEAKLFAKAVDVGLVILGVCRGAQLGCALSGGILAQDVEGHHMPHMVTTIDGRSFPSSSIHHQMMYPWNTEHELIAWTSYPKSGTYQGITDEEMEKWQRDDYGYPDKSLPIEPEIVWFPKTKCLAIQGHPEMMAWGTQFNQFLKTLVKEKCE